MSAMLDRQIAWMMTVMQDLEEVESGGNEAALEQLVALQKMREEELAAMLREQEFLLAEWRAAPGIPDEERARIRRLAESAANLAEQIGKCYDRAVAWAKAEMKQCSEAMQSLRRGRDMLTRYQPGMDEAPGFIDRKA
ncbi:MAG TPA: hypothetical protein ENN65_03425 [Candidatus Hydrogenedentes bacterium]|nr:hypothetical protein [Candidatus Hydrogenedentota bacterium]